MTYTDNEGTIIAAAMSLAAVCDHATSQDGQGYNGRDAEFMHSCVRQHNEGRHLTQKQLQAMYKTLRTYKSQLSGFDINYDELTEPELETITPQTGNIDPTWESFMINFGKRHNGESLATVWKNDPDYVGWLARDFSRDDVKVAAQHVIAGEPIPQPKPPKPVDDILGKFVITFGKKHNGETMGEVWLDDPDYIKWLARKSYMEDVKENAQAIIDNDPAHIEHLKEKKAEKKANKEELVKLSTAVSSDSDFEMPPGFGRGKKTLYPYQLVGAEFLERAGGCAMICDTVGCISGDALISIHRAGRSFKIKLERLHHQFNTVTERNQDWKNSIPTMARSLMPDGTFRLNKVLNVIDKGIKEILLIKTQQGKELKLTPDHKIKTPNGWLEVEKLDIGDTILTNGKPICKLCGSDENVITYKYAKYKGFCKKCMYRQLHNNNLTYSRSINSKDGSKYIRGGLKYHPNTPINGMPEHRLIVEADMNGISLETWLSKLYKNDIKGCKFLSVDLEVHHIDGDASNNQIDNLQICTKLEHHTIDKRYKNFVDIFIPKKDIIISIECAGIERVFDITMDDPAHNFIANGIVVHNCGKSAQSLSYLQNHPEARPAIIVAPASVKYQWYDYCYEWLATDDLIEVITNTSRDQFIGDIIILNYDILKKNLDVLKTLNPKVIIYDEFHKIKNYKTQRTIAATDLALDVPHRILLSGTPWYNHTKELWGPLCIVDKERYNKRTFFPWHKKYCGAKQTKYGWDFSGNTNTEELAEELKHIMIRRTEEDVFDDLPELIRTVIPITISNRHVYNKAKDDHIAWIMEERGRAAADKAKRAEHLTRIEYLKQLVAEGKTKYAIQWIEDYLTSEDKLVVFTMHKAVTAAVMKKFGKAALKIDGTISTGRERLDIANRFETDPKIKIIVCNMIAASEGLNLGVSKAVLFLEQGWSPKLHEQCEGRIKGLRQAGRDRKLIYSYYLVGYDTIDIEIAAMLEAKRKVGDTAMGDDVKLDFDFFSKLVK